jgi:hypothetical protein
LAGCRLEAAAASLFEQTARPDSARRARQRFEHLWRRLERSTRPHPLESWDKEPSAHDEEMH